MKTSGISKFCLCTVQYDDTDASFLKMWSVSCLGVLFIFFVLKESACRKSGRIWLEQVRIVVRGDLQNKILFGDNFSPTASMRTVKYILEDNKSA